MHISFGNGCDVYCLGSLLAHGRKATCPCSRCCVCPIIQAGSMTLRLVKVFGNPSEQYHIVCICFVGQQQILCLAWVLLQQPKIMCLDEATANVDPDTARLMQQVLRTHLRHSAVLQIAHRLDAILDCGWAVVMDQGKVVEQGSPQDLREDQQSPFAALHQAAGST